MFFRRILTAVAVIAALVIATGGVLHAETSLELSVSQQDRRNQIGDTMLLWDLRVDIPLEDWAFVVHLSFDDRLREVEGFRIQPPVSIRRDFRNGYYLLGYDKLPDWGYGRTPLVLSSDTPALLQARWGFGDERVDYEKVVGVLDFGAKYLFAHRIALRPTDRFEFSAAEVSIGSEKVAATPMNYLPGWPVYLSQHLGIGDFGNDELNSNISVGARWQLPWGLVYGDFFVDDMPQEAGHHDAYLVAGQVGLMKPVEVYGRPGTVGVEYTRVNNWTYTFRDLPYSYTHQGYVLGHWIGPDSDLLDVYLVLPARGKAAVTEQSQRGTVEFSYQLLRQGEGKIGDDWEKYGKAYAMQHLFLTGVVDRRSTLLAHSEYISPHSYRIYPGLLL